MARESKKPLQPVVAESSTLSFLDEGVVIDWISRNKNVVFYGLVALVALLIAFFRLSSGSSSKAEHNYLKAAKEFQVFVQTTDPLVAKEALSQVETLMSKYPELHAAYDGMITQTLLNRGEVEQAQPFANATLQRTRNDDLPFYRDFAETTLLITQQNYQKALTQATTLQQKMADMLQQSPDKAELAFGEELFALNLFRIGMLAAQLEDKTTEMQTWKQWRQYAGLEAGESTKNLDSARFLSAGEKLTIGSMKLPDYIAYRLGEKS